jgi:hypothetical protein
MAMGGKRNSNPGSIHGNTTTVSQPHSCEPYELALVCVADNNEHGLVSSELFGQMPHSVTVLFPGTKKRPFQLSPLNVYLRWG